MSLTPWTMLWGQETGIPGKWKLTYRHETAQPTAVKNHWILSRSTSEKFSETVNTAGYSLSMSIKSANLPGSAMLLFFDSFCWCLFFCFAFFGMASPAAHGISQATGQIETAAAGLSHSHNKFRIQATSATYTTIHSNVGSLTHQERPGIEPTLPWIRVSFITCWATTATPFLIFLQIYWSMIDLQVILIKHFHFIDGTWRGIDLPKAWGNIQCNHFQPNGKEGTYCLRNVT